VEPEDEDRLVLVGGLLTHRPEVGVPANPSPVVFVVRWANQISYLIEALWCELEPGDRSVSWRRWVERSRDLLLSPRAGGQQRQRNCRERSLAGQHDVRPLFDSCHSDFANFSHLTSSVCRYRAFFLDKSSHCPEHFL
jgi:hypothetical protein